MNVETTNALAILGAAAVFALIFYGRVLVAAEIRAQETRRRVVSFSTGMAVAYVFVHLLPELAAATSEFVEISEERELPFADLMVYGAALLGFMLFYGLENMVSWSRLTHPRAVQTAREGARIRSAGADRFLRALRLRRLLRDGARVRAGGGQLALYALAMGLHFLGFAYALRRDSDTAYQQRGRHVLAAAALLGWAVALLLPVPEAFAYTLLGFVAGVLIMDTVTSELAGEAEGRFPAFLAGGAVYTVVLLLIAR